MKKRDLVLINMSSYSEWANGISNRNFHIFKELEKHPEIDKIFCVDFPPLTWRRAIRNYFDLPPLVLGKAVRDYRENTNLLTRGKVIKRDLLGRVTKLSDRLYVYSSAEFFLNPTLYCQRLKKQLTAFGFNEFVVWSFFHRLCHISIFLVRDCQSLMRLITGRNIAHMKNSKNDYSAHMSTLRKIRQ
jgi:hypothetical protein